MTQRLYYTDPSLRTFDATIAAVHRRDNSLAVTLDRTAFYPTSGGQPFDTGTLGGFRVVDVIDQEDGSVVHVLNLELRTKNLEPEPGHRNLEPGTLNLEPGAPSATSASS